MLINRQVLRGREEHEALLWRLGGALLLFDAYLTRSRLGGGGDREATRPTRTARRRSRGEQRRLRRGARRARARRAARFCAAAAAAARSQLGARACESWRQLLETVVLSSFGRSLVLLDMIWVYRSPSAARSSLRAAVQRHRDQGALRCSTPQAAAIVAAGAAARACRSSPSSPRGTRFHETSYLSRNFGMRTPGSSSLRVRPRARRLAAAAPLNKNGGGRRLQRRRLLRRHRVISLRRG